MAPQGQGSHVMTTIFLLPLCTLLLSIPLRAPHSASLTQKLRYAALDACTKLRHTRVAKHVPQRERHNARAGLRIILMRICGQRSIDMF